jgi:hypothetical protein
VLFPALRPKGAAPAEGEAPAEGAAPASEPSA